MTRRTKGCSWLTRAGACLAAVLMVLAGSVSVGRASGENDSGRDAQPAAAAVPVRTAPEKQGRQRLAEERAMVNALAGKRDPFNIPPPPQVNGKGEGMDESLPPGVRGLVIGRLRLKGILREEDTHMMIAVVTNAANLAYFLHIHEDVYNGVVSKITPDALYFQQRRLDTRGRMEAREVVLRLGPARQEAR
ncbi:MAG: hypothetical protein WB819_00340 [Terriglobia bacterium]